MLVQHGKTKFVLGISWHLPQDKKDMKTLIGQRPGQSRVVVKAGESTWIGFDEQRKVGVAAALVIASIYPDLLLAERLSDEQYWLCAIYQGMPAPGRDIIVGADEARAALYEWVSFFPAARVFGDIEGSQGAVAEIWEQVLNAIAAKDITQKRLREYSLKAVLTRRELSVVGAGVLVTAAVAGAAWMALGPKPLTPQEVSDQEQAALQSQAQNKAELERRDAIAARIKAHQDQVDIVRARVDSARSGSFLPSWLKLFRGLPLTIDGYRPTNMTCTQQICQIEWRGTPGVRAQDKFSLESRTGATPRGSASNPMSTPAAGGPAAVVQLSNSMGDYGTLLDYSVERTQRDHVPRQVAPVSEQDFDRLRARLLDLNAALTHGKSQIQIGPARSLAVGGVPEGQVPDVHVALVADLHLAVNGASAGHDLLLIDEQIIRQMAGLGVVLQWNRMVLMGSSGSDSIIADGEMFFPISIPR